MFISLQVNHVNIFVIAELEGEQAEFFSPLSSFLLFSSSLQRAKLVRTILEIVLVSVSFPAPTAVKTPIKFANDREKKVNSFPTFSYL